MYIPWDHLSDLADLWVIKIKSLWSFARVVHRNHMNRAQNADQAARTCERFVYSVVKITRLYDYQTWQTFFEKFKRCAKVCGLFILDCAFWLLIGWASNTPITCLVWSVTDTWRVRTCSLSTVDAWAWMKFLDIFLYIVWLASCKYESLFRACTQ